MRFFMLFAVTVFLLGLAGCRSSPPPPPDGPGVHVQVPGVNVDVRPDR
jgi:hypothetical protein